MKRITIICALLALFSLSSWAQTLPEGATLMYYGKLRWPGYGNYLESITIYQRSGDYYLHRERGFAGAKQPATSKKEKVAMLPVLTMPLSKGQLQTIQKWVAVSQIDSRCEACNDEERRQTDSAQFSPFDMASWKLVVEWPGVMTGLSSEGQYKLVIGDNQHPCRDVLVHTMGQLHSYIDEIADKYAKKHIDKLWRE